jgi:homocysteine S-methyltransferase
VGRDDLGTRAADVVVLDGGLATQLERRGNDLSDDLWSARLLLDDPDEVVAAHLDFFRAGAQVATSASYQASVAGFAARGIETEQAQTLILRSVELAGRARERMLAERDGPGPDLRVAASVGPYGAVLADGSEYTGDYGISSRALRDFHGSRLELLAGSGADLLAVETLPSLQEVEVLVGLIDELAPGVPVWVSVTCADAGRTRHGEPVADAFAAAAASRHVTALGVNCTAPEHALELVGAAASTGKPVVVYPNSGEGWDAARRRWNPSGGSDVDGSSARRWVAAGARYVGGCCRVTPEQISDIAAAVIS